jgi:hypothetical protein
VPPGPVGEPDSLDRLLQNARGDGLARAEIETLWSRVGPAILVGAGVGVGATAGANAGAASGATAGAGAGTAASTGLAAGAGAGTAAAAGGAGAAGVSLATGVAGFGAKTIVALLVGGSLAAAGATHAYRVTHPPAPPPIQVSVEEGSRGATQQSATRVDTQAAAPSLPAVDVGSLPVAGQAARPSPKGRGSQAVDHTLARRFPDDDTTAPESAIGAGGASSYVGSPSAGGQGGSSQRGASGSAPAPNEGSILLRARQQLGSDPAAALALTDEHARRYPSGSLTQEREVLAIEALTRLGRISDARARLAAFRDRFPQSAHIARLEALVDR